MNSVPEGKESSGNNYDEDVGKRLKCLVILVLSDVVPTKKSLNPLGVVLKILKTGTNVRGEMRTFVSSEMRMLPWLIKQDVKSTCPNCRSLSSIYPMIMKK